MANRRNSGGVVEDIWMNTQVGLDDLDGFDRDDRKGYSDWNEVEEANVLINPDVYSMEDRG